jgi:hypothetical protein
MSKRWLALVGASLALWSGAANADDKAQCFDAAGQAQTLRDAHKLVEARDQLRVCARQSCPSQVAKDCSTWLDSVEQSLPTVVVSAKDATGRDLFDFTVTIDGQPLAAKSAGEAVPVNPGPHTFHFQGSDGSGTDQQVLVREGVKNQAVAVVLAKTGAPAPTPGAAPTPPPTEHVEPLPQSADTGTPRKSSSLRTVGWILGGVGVAGIGVGAVFGVVAIGDKNNAHCNSSNACQSGPLSDARTAATISTVSVVAGAVLLAGGAAIVLFGPSGHSESAQVKLAPLVGANDAGMQLVGSF